MSLAALFVFTVCTGIGFTYAVVKTGDFFIMLDYGLCMVGEAATLILASIRRLQLSPHRSSQFIYKLIPSTLTTITNRI